jgi:unconventional prefoldin RPB5 interactor 1
MANTIKDSFIDLERHRQNLETNVAKLKKSLQHWQTWSAEYEGLKEEIQLLSNPSHDDLLTVAQTFDGELLTQKEIEELLGLNVPRTPEQIVNVVERRIDYVVKNVETVEKQLRDAENKVAAVEVVAAPEYPLNEEGLPLTEITEELDEEGNVVSARTSTPGGQKEQLLEVLEKVGVKEKDFDTKKDERVAEVSDKEAAALEKDKSQKVDALRPDAAGEDVSGRMGEMQIDEFPKGTIIDDVTETEPVEEIPRSFPIGKPVRKDVSFAGDTKPGPSTTHSATARRVKEIMNIAKKQNGPVPSDAIVPDTDNPEEAALRRQMLAYGMSEIGPIVAELELESDEYEDEDEGYDDDTSDMDDDEDEFGRSTRPVLTGDIHRRMRELEGKLGVRMMENIGPNHSAEPTVELGANPSAGIGQVRITMDDGDGKAAIKRNSPPLSNLEIDEPSASSSTDTQPKKKRGVRFAPELDIQEAPGPPSPVLKLPVVRKVAPIRDIIERKLPAQATAIEPAAPTPKKTSRFKAARQPSTEPILLPQAPPAALAYTSPRSARTVPTGPEDSVLASQVMERLGPSSGEIAEPDELDPALLQQEVAAEYHKMRNRMVMREGGFSKEAIERLDVGPGGKMALDEEEGGAKKMSRFRRARLGLSVEDEEF